jgi:hypothetical protein
VSVAATPAYTEHPSVADAASALLRDVFVDRSIAARLGFGVASLPRGAPVEREGIVAMKS